MTLFESTVSKVNMHTRHCTQLLEDSKLNHTQKDYNSLFWPSHHTSRLSQHVQYYSPRCCKMYINCNCISTQQHGRFLLMFKATAYIAHSFLLHLKISNKNRSHLHARTRTRTRSPFSLVLFNTTPF